MAAISGGTETSKMNIARPTRFVVAALSLGIACSSGSRSPTEPSAPFYAAGTTLTVTSGEDGRPVAGAAVTVSGTSSAGLFSQTYVSDVAGRVALDRIVLQEPMPAVDVVAAGYLKRETLLRPADDRTFSLWPTISPTGLTETFSALVVYSAARCPARLDAGSLRRHNPSTKDVAVVLDSTLQSPEEIHQHELAVQVINAMTGSAPKYFVAATAPPGALVIQVTLSPARCAGLNAAAFTTRRGDGAYITGGEVVYCAPEYARTPRTIVHELGHTTGLNHSDAPGLEDMMSCTNAETLGAFSSREQLAMKLMLQRPGANEWPDRDRFSTTTASSTRHFVETISCPR